MSKRLSFGYEDTDKKIEIDLYGLVFEVKLKNEDIQDLRNIKDDIKLKELEVLIDKYLGKNAVEQINNKRKEDGHKEIDEDVAIQIIICMMKAYSNVSLSGLTDTIDDIDGKINNTIANMNKVKQFNRNGRRNYNRKSYRRY